MTDARLIERWLPIAALGEESVRERRSMTALPPTYYLHVWWARRPLVACRAAVLASVLTADADRDKFMHALGIHGDPIAAKRRIALADRRGERLGAAAYGYARAFAWTPDAGDRKWLSEGGVNASLAMLDPMAGGGSIPFEGLRLGVSAFANDLNPVATLILKATLEYPLKHGTLLVAEFKKLGDRFVGEVRRRLQGAFPPEPNPDDHPDGYLWARTIRCPYCDGLVPLSPNWRLDSNGTGVRLRPHLGGGPHAERRICEFEIVQGITNHSSGTVAMGDAICPFSDCGRVIDGDELRRQAQAGEVGHQLFAVVFKRRVKSRTKSGSQGREKWERGFRAPRAEDDNKIAIAARISEKIPEWDALGIMPYEEIESAHPKYDPRRWGMNRWQDFFSARQLLCHCTSVEVFCEMLAGEGAQDLVPNSKQAAYVYLALAIDTMLNYGNVSCRWDAGTQRVRSIFDRHDFAFCWSYAEIVPLIPGVGYDWAIQKTAKCIEQLVVLVRNDEQNSHDLLSRSACSTFQSPSIMITSKPGDMLDHIADRSIDVVVIDPPYYDNVMYAELSDFFYVWLKRTAGYVIPELFTRSLTDKENEAVANPTKFAGQKSPMALAGLDYQERMARIFDECRRILKSSGIMTLMFTHKATGAWDALGKGLIDAGFIITASWPINTEAEAALNIKNKAAANSTIFLVCRPRAGATQGGASNYWEDIEPLVGQAVRRRVKEFQEAGIAGVDLYLASFGPALEEFSRHWPLRRGTPRPKPEMLRKRRQTELFEDEWDPYAVTPEDALDAARREVKRWRLEQLTHMKASDELDPLTSFFVLAWDAFRAPVFPYDEALRLARAVGVDLDRQVVGVLVEKKGSDLRIWDSAQRAAKGALGPPDGTRGMIDALHHAAHLGRTRTLQAAREMLTKTGVDHEPMFFAALEAVLEVLPVGKVFSGIDLDGDLAASSSDFEVLENLRRFAFTELVDPPKQLELWLEPATA
jgi:putative DNA methylase